MVLTTRARVALFLSIVAVLIAGVLGARAVSAGSENVGGGSAPGADDAVAGICAAPAPGEPEAECNDTIGEPPGDAVACGEEQVSGSGPDAAVSFAPCPDDRVPAPGDGAQLVVPRPGMAGVRPHPFDRAVGSDDGTRLTVFFWSGVEPCYVLDRVEVAYGDRAITVTLFEGHDPDAIDAVCIEIALLKKVVVDLDEPVGDRRIADGAA